MKDEANCAVSYGLSILDGKWKLRAVWIIRTEKTIRFNELKRRLTGISNIMLSKSLQELEADHIIIRKQYNEIPPRVEYSLTDLRKSLTPALNLLGEWGKCAYKLKNNP